MTIKSAVIGVGYLGKFHAEKFKKSERSELVAVVDRDLDRAKLIASDLGVQALNDYRALPGLGVQCASIASDTTSHFEIASFLLQAGVDVLVEKPMTVTTDEARELIRLAKQHSRILQVGHLERFNPAFRAVKRALNNPRFFEVRRIAQFTGRAFDVDVVRDLMIHDIDLISHLVGKPITHIDAQGVPVITNSVDIANARLTFEGGAVANVTASRAALKSERSFRIFQPQLYVSMDFGAKKIKMSKIAPPETAGGFPKIDASELQVEERDALRDEIEAFLTCVADRSEPEVTGVDGMRALELAEQITAVIAKTLDEERSRNYQLAGNE